MARDLKRREFLAKSSAVALGATVSTFFPDRVDGGQTRPHLLDLTASDAVAAMRKGEITAEHYAQALLDRAQSLERLNAFRTLNREMVLEAARGADKSRASGAALGAVHGLPIPVKDSVNTKSLPTSNGTRALKDFRPKDDAAVLKPLFAQGAILMGKTNLHELSYGWTSNNPVFGAVRNPYDTDRVPGGSSGGSAAAVAAHMAPLAIAEDTLGSIRVPATMCGLTGLRPSYGRYPDDGILPLSTSKFDQVGPLARTVADIVLFDSVVTGNTTRLTALSLKGARIAVSEFLWSDLDPEVERISTRALEKLRAAGATIVRVEAPESVKSAMEIAFTLIGYDTMPAVSAFLKDYGTGVSFDELLGQASQELQVTLKASALPAVRPSREVYDAMVARRAQLREAIGAYFKTQRIAAMLFPTIRVPAPRIGEENEVEFRGTKLPMALAMARNIALGSCASMASLILPAGLTSSGLPVGLEFAALSGKDRQLLSLGLSLEKALGRIPGPRI
jgi:Asp-tRNA(Asn)/Glu-tRNA(Gln) amidotransferase A subunit family amidase